MALAFNVEVIAADRKLFAGKATSLTLPGADGYFGVLYGHAPLIGALGIGELTLTDENGKETLLAIHGGFVEVGPERTLVLADAAEMADAIDVERAQLAMRRAETRLQQATSAEKAGNIDFERARIALMRAINRMRVAERAKM
jgi:F-type H+-transporting ATPase subunit epsilon